MKVQAAKQQLLNYVDQNAKEIINCGRQLYNTPELAYREVETGNYICESLKAAKMQTKRAAVQGVCASISGEKSGKTYGVIAEMDALYTPLHPSANKTTGAAHTCGHHIQTTALITVGRAFMETGIYRQMHGKLALFACPAEEGTPANVVEELANAKKIAFSSGKQQMIEEGCFEQVDGLLSTHALINDDKVLAKALLSLGCNGYNKWIFSFTGQTAHTTMDPSKGVNAVNAALLAVHGIQCVRECFPLNDYCMALVSLKEICENPGSVPHRAVLEVTVKSRTMSILQSIQEKVKNACQGAAHSLGCHLDTTFEEGYKPYVADKFLSEIYTKNASLLLKEPVQERQHGYYSNDLGNVNQIIPISQIVFGGFSGALHSERFCIEDEEMAYLMPAKAMLATLAELLIPQ